MLHEAENEAEAKTYEAEADATKFDLKANRGLNISRRNCVEHDVCRLRVGVT